MTTITHINNAIETATIFEDQDGTRLEVVTASDGSIQIGLFAPDDENLESTPFPVTREQAIELVAHLL